MSPLEDLKKVAKKADGGFMRKGYAMGTDEDDIPEAEDMPMDEYMELLKSLGAPVKGQESGIRSIKSPIQKASMDENEELIDSFTQKIGIRDAGTDLNVSISTDDGGTWKVFKNGTIKSPYVKTVFGRGFMGVGENKSREPNNGKKTKKYLTWFAMMQRCYSNNSKKIKPTYIGCSVCEKWHNFQIFCDWFDENYYTIGESSMCLDKDMLFKGNKVYSPETCVFVPQELNKLLTKRNRFRGALPLGVSISGSGYNSSCNRRGKTISLGHFDTIENAFCKYKEFKEELMAELANEYKEIIPNALYKALQDYRVDITD